MIYFPACKINLGLHILRKRTDGYHDIETAMLEIPFCDVLEIIPSGSFAFSSSGIEIPGEGNSCIDAFELMRSEFGIPPVKIHLHKNVPSGGGLGGGSSDSAQTLKALNELFDLGCSVTQLEGLAARLGSDDPFFIRGGFQLATGRGEVLQPIARPMPVMRLVVVNFGIHIPTAAAYAAVTPNADREPLPVLLELPAAAWKKYLVNDFEASVFPQHPELERAKAQLYEAGAVYAAMSGSGSTLFGFFEERPPEIAWETVPVYEHWF